MRRKAVMKKERYEAVGSRQEKKGMRRKAVNKEGKV